jgi:protein required for attachment to host cells
VRNALLSNISEQQGADMNLRIVVADERQANFFDATQPNLPLTARGSLQNEKAGLKDTDLETDRAGRRFGGSSGVTHGSGPVQGHHHGVDGERSTEKHELTLFAKAVAERIDADRVAHQFDKLVIVAPPKMLGLLRQSLPTTSQSLLAGEVSKDILHQGPDAIHKAVPWDVFSQLH